MIGSYKDKSTKDFASGKTVKKWEPFRRQAERRLRLIEAAEDLRDLAALGGNRLERLRGDRKNQHSIRINNQWRICFEWSDTQGALNVEICDYH